MIRKYREIAVVPIDTTKEPLRMLARVLDMPIKNIGIDYEPSLKDIERRLKDTFEMEHETIFEFVDLTFLILGLSGAALRQIRTHRIASWMASSHHYQDASKFALTMDQEPSKRVADALNILYEEFELQKNVVGKAEARMWLPVAASYNLLMKINATSLANFFKKRLCRRNTKEMRTIALKMYVWCLEYCKPLFSLMGPTCLTCGKCNQKKMTCGKPFIYEEEVHELLTKK